MKALACVLVLPACVQRPAFLDPRQPGGSSLPAAPRASDTPADPPTIA